MPAATASGADKTPTEAAKSRDHNQGNQDRKYTVEQKAAVIRVRRCSPTSFYEILGLEEVKTTVTESEIKKAYRKLSLLTHPDKNGHEHADEAFKMVSRAFGVLSDKDKKAKYDRFGGDPDSRFGGGAPQQSPFSGFARTPSSSARGGGGGMWEDEISPEEMFNRFFGGGGGGGGFGPFGGGEFELCPFRRQGADKSTGGGIFDAGPGFVFNLGGGPGVRVHQFGGARPRGRPRDPNQPEDAPASFRSTIMGLLPLLILFVLPLLSSLFSGSGSTPVPTMRFDGPVAPHTQHRLTTRFKVDYFLNPAEVDGYTAHKYSQLDQTAEVKYVQQLRYACEQEQEYQQRLVNEAQGWFVQDEDKMNRARNLEMKNCRKLDSMSLDRRSSY
jgi:DnaJ family protein B protein 12